MADSTTSLITSIINMILMIILLGILLVIVVFAGSCGLACVGLGVASQEAVKEIEESMER